MSTSFYLFRSHTPAVIASLAINSYTRKEIFGSHAAALIRHPFGTQSASVWIHIRLHFPRDDHGEHGWSSIQRSDHLKPGNGSCDEYPYPAHISDYLRYPKQWAEWPAPRAVQSVSYTTLSVMFS
jgi:hypothetical protein